MYAAAVHLCAFVCACHWVFHGQVEKHELLTEKVQLLARVREQAKEHLLESKDHARALPADR